MYNLNYLLFGFDFRRIYNLNASLNFLARTKMIFLMKSNELFHTNRINSYKNEIKTQRKNDAVTATDTRLRCLNNKTDKKKSIEQNSTVNKFTHF